MFDIIIENGYNNFESPFGKMALLHFAQKCCSFSKIHFPQLKTKAQRARAQLWMDEIFGGGNLKN